MFISILLIALENPLQIYKKYIVRVFYKGNNSY
jgi:hypothetical protein